MNYSEYLDRFEIFSIIKERADFINVKAYVIGGFVRDLILGRLSKDIDIVCVGTPDNTKLQDSSGITLAKEVAGILENILKRKVKVSVYKNYGTAMLNFNDLEIEFVGARRESYHHYSRKPVVEDGTLEDDQNRRDFTINALALGLNKHDFGELIDPFNGVRDLESKRITTPLNPEITFSDDPLRMMRAVRFAAQLSNKGNYFDIVPATFDAIRAYAGRIDIVSKERISEELNKILLSPVPGYGLKLLFHAGLLQKFFPELAALQGVETLNGKSHKDNFYHTLQVLDNIAEVSDNLWLRWAALLHDIAKPLTKRYDQKAGWTFHGHEEKGAQMVPHIFRKLRLPMDSKMKYVQKLVRLHLRPIALVHENITDAAIRRLLFEAGDDIEDLMKLCRADITSKNHIKVKKFLENFDKVEQKMHEVEKKDRMRNFQPPVTGEDIMQSFNLKPSKVVGEIKSEIREAILEGHIQNDREEGLQYMMEIGQRKGLTLKKEIH